MQDSKLMQILLKRGFIWPSFEIYGGVKGFYDYGPLGSLLKRNIEEAIRQTYVIEESCFELSCPTLSPEDIWVASGHVSSFNDMMVECTKCGEPYRADHLIEANLKINCDGKGIDEIKKLLEKLKCPKCKSMLSEPYKYNLMFKSYVGPGSRKITAYLRPETAQTTYVPFKRLIKIARDKLPFGVLQIGRSFRNEISPRQGLVRLREFTQAEIQFFVDPANKEKELGEFANLNLAILPKDGKEINITLGKALKQKIIRTPFIAYHLGKAFQLFTKIGINPKKLRLRQHLDDERAFYSSDTWDIEFMSKELGRIELVGISDRTDYDLKAHQNLSKQSMEVTFNGKRFIPHIIEIAYGVDRPFYCILESCFVEETGKKERNIFKFPANIAPYIAAVFPLVTKDRIDKKAEEVFNKLKNQQLFVLYDSAGSIGRRYARADEAGIPYCITIDYDTLEDNTVTIRYRDSMEQERVQIDKIKEKIMGK
jgi:glycyl-tRNA synthetase